MICIKFDQKVKKNLKNLNFGLLRFLNKPKKPRFFWSHFPALAVTAIHVALWSVSHMFNSGRKAGQFEMQLEVAVLTVYCSKTNTLWKTTTNKIYSACIKPLQNITRSHPWWWRWWYSHNQVSPEVIENGAFKLCNNYATYTLYNFSWWAVNDKWN